MAVYKGRKKIYTDETYINSDNVISVLSDALTIHQDNVREIEFLELYERGEQPILGRKKEIRSDINVKVLENNASLITDFKVGYEFGSPITYVQRAKVEVPESNPDCDDKRITALNDMLHEENKASKDVELARNFKVCGVGYRMIRPKQYIDGTSVFDVLILDPKCTFIVYSNDIYKRPMLAVTYNKNVKNGTTRYGCYTNDRYYEITENLKIINGEVSQKEKEKIISNSFVHDKGLGVPLVPPIIPIVEYKNDSNRQGCFEKVIPLLDAINITNSDRVNDVAQHVQSIMWLHNCKLPEDASITSNGCIETESTSRDVQASIKFLDQPLDQQGVQTLSDHLTAKAMTITGTPERQDNSGGSTGSAVSLSSGWQIAETLAQTSDAIFDEAEKQCIRIILEILKVSTDIPKEYQDIVNLKLSDITIRHSRNKIYDIATKTNALATMLNSGIDALHAIETVCLFTNPQAVYTDSKEVIAEMQASKQLKVNNTQNMDFNNPTDTEAVNSDRLNQDSSDQPQKSAFSG